MKHFIKSNPSPKPNPNLNLKAKPTSTPNPDPNQNVVDNQLNITRMLLMIYVCRASIEDHPNKV